MTQLLSDANTINTLVNTSTLYKTDQQQYGKVEYWTPANIGGAGDCEDYSLAKRNLLLEMGWSKSDVCLVGCTAETGAGHCVLFVKTNDAGWVVLDNRTDELLKPFDCGYQWYTILRWGIWWRLWWWRSMPITLLPILAPEGWADYLKRTPTDPDNK